MFRNCLAAALRHLLRSRLQAALSIAGLTIGLTAAMLIGLYVHDELNYDRWIPGYSAVYRVVLGLELGNVRTPPAAGTAAPMAGWLKADYPQVLAAGRMQADVRTLRRADVSGTETLYWADPEIFDVLPLPALSGDPHTALLSPDGLVLTRHMARKYFGRDDPLGESLLVDGKFPLRVTAVLEDLPLQTHLAAELFASARNSAATLPPLSAPLRLNVGFDQLTAALTYIRLRPGADPKVMERTLQAKMEAHVAIPRGPAGKPLVPAPKIYMQPLRSIHFVPAGVHSMKPAGDLQAVYAIAVIGFLILLVACVNFVNLTTARASRRAAEVGVRRLSGATRIQLLLQFLAESLGLVAVSTLLAMAVVELLLSPLNAFLERDMAFNWWQSPQACALFLVATLSIGVLAGAYPAFVLAGMRPARVLNARPLPPGGRLSVRTALVTVQFSVLIALLLVTAVIYLQTRFATNDSLRFDKDQVVVVRSGCGNAFLDAVRALPGVRQAACTDAQFGIGGGWVGVHAAPDGSRATAVTYVAVDWGLLKLFGLKPLAGRLFSSDRPGDVTELKGGDVRAGSGGSVVINETAARDFGFVSAAAAVGQPAKFVPTEGRPATIIGVVADFQLQGMRHEIQPTVFRVTPGMYNFVMVKLQGRGIPETLAAIDTLWKRTGNSSAISRRFLDDAIQAQYVDLLRQAQVLAIFAAIVVLIACLGLFGLSACIAERRTREIGIRKTMGASTANILQLLIWQFCQPVLWANLIAWPLAGWAMHRWLQGFPYHIDLSPGLFVTAGAVVILIALATVGAQAVTVARAKPVAALRYE
jgi:putative ABC transport system permease protein